MDEENVTAQAILFAKKNKKQIAKKHTDISIYPADVQPVSVFMAGSPGAGKTEFSRHFVETFETEMRKIVRIDPDDFRPLLPGYVGINSYLFQGAVSIITDRVLDEAFHKGQSFILDGTCSHLDQAVRNIQRALGKNRIVFVYFIYQDPVTAWEITKVREKKEGRNIQKETFIKEFFGAQEVVSELKEKFSDNIFLCFVDKEVSRTSVEVYFGINTIKEYLPHRFTKDELRSILKE